MSRWTRRGSRSAAVATLACIPLTLFGPAASAQTFPPLAWTAPVTVEHAPFARGNLMTASSCPGAGLCAVADDVGNIFTSTDPASTTDNWRAAAVSPGHGIGFLTCPATNFCVALETVKGRELILTSVNPTGGRRAWTQARAPMLLRAISCPSTRLCVAVGKGAITTSTNPTAGQHSVWKVTSFGPQLSSIRITGVSCPRPALCVAGDDEGNVYTSKNPTGGKSAWTITTVVADAALKAVTCPSASFCAAIETFGLVYSTNPAGGGPAWHQVTSPIFKGSLTCVSATFCAAAGVSGGSNGHLWTTTDPAGGTAAWHRSSISMRGELNTLSCGSPQLCAAGDKRGDVLSSSNPTGGLPAWTTFNVTGVSGILSLDCPFAALCLAGDNAGNILTSTRPAGGASAWHTAHVGGPPAVNGVFADIIAISCPTTHLCVAVDDQADALWSTNPTGGASAWSKATVDTQLGFGYFLDSLACPTTSLCIAADSEGNILTSTNPTGGGPAWHVASMGPNVRDLYVTCPNASLCVASDDTTIFASTNPAGGVSTWHPSVNFPKAGGIGPITCPTTSLCVALAEGTILWSRRPTGGIVDWNHVSLPSPPKFDFYLSGGTISCPSARFCLAGSQIQTSAGAHPSIFASSDPASTKASAWQKAGVSAAAVSCSSSSLCLAGNDLGQVQVGTPRAPTSTTLNLSAKRIAFGREQGERLTVTVRPRLSGAPAGTVVISAKTKTICTLRHLNHGTASCTLTRRQLRPGTYRLVARYSGSSTFLSSKSAAKVLTVFTPR